MYRSVKPTTASMLLLLMMMMMCNDLMCTYKLTGSQLSLVHNAKVKTDMPEKNEKQLESMGSVRMVMCEIR